VDEKLNVNGHFVAVAGDDRIVRRDGDLIHGGGSPAS
jgi:hypothetical protein